MYTSFRQQKNDPSAVRRRKWLLIVSWTLVFLCMAVIFALSQQEASQSQETSDGVLRWLLEHLNLQVSSHTVRKTAHALEYCGLEVLLYFAYLASFRMPQAALSLLTNVLYAASDEIHQYFIAGRSCQLRDVFVDFLGAAAGLAACMFLYGLFIFYQKKRHRKWQC